VRHHDDPLRFFPYGGWLSDEQREAYYRDEKLALMLLSGHRSGRFPVGLASKNDLPKRRMFLSRKTKPTENEAREALCRILLNRHVPPSAAILKALVGVFVSHDDFAESFYGRYPLKALLKRRSKGHPNLDRDLAISLAVDRLRDSREAKTLEEAAARLGDAIGMHEDHIKRVYSRVKRELGPAPRSRKRGRPRSGKSVKRVMFWPTPTE
jgi:hypothetical protein